MPNARTTTAWTNLETLAPRPTLRELFAADPARSVIFTKPYGNFVADFSKQRIDSIVADAALDVVRAAGLEERRDAMFAGGAINTTEGRSVLHTALRAPRGTSVTVNGENVVPMVHDVLDRMSAFAHRVRSGEWRGHTGRPIRNVINIGIGGSDLGPAMATHALRNWSDRAWTHRFVSNVDGSDIREATLDLDPGETLVIVASKTFTTIETMTNAISARAWLTSVLGPDAVPKHMVAVSTNAAKVTEFGIDTANMFGFWDWVGGRYSVGSAVGLSLMLAIGPDHFTEFLAGFRDGDDHFRSTPLAENVPVLMAAAGVWERNVLGSPSVGVIPYCNELAMFPAYLQQLDMESNGKRVRLDGSALERESGPIVWGTPGTNGQHAYFQLLHQGTTVVPLDLIGFARPVHDIGDHHDVLIANLLAQSAALAFGKTADEVRSEGTADHLIAHRTFPGNRPTTVLLGDRLTPRTLGQLIALYEHKVFTQGVMWGVNSFDQWGVELGKVLALAIYPALDGTGGPALDPSTQALVTRYRMLRDR